MIVRPAMACRTFGTSRLHPRALSGGENNDVNLAGRLHFGLLTNFSAFESFVDALGSETKALSSNSGRLPFRLRLLNFCYLTN